MAREGGIFTTGANDKQFFRIEAGEDVDQLSTARVVHVGLLQSCPGEGPVTGAYDLVHSRDK